MYFLYYKFKLDQRSLLIYRRSLWNDFKIESSTHRVNRSFWQKKLQSAKSGEYGGHCIKLSLHNNALFSCNIHFPAVFDVFSQKNYLFRTGCLVISLTVYYLKWFLGQWNDGSIFFENATETTISVKVELYKQTTHYFCNLHLKN